MFNHMVKHGSEPLDRTFAALSHPVRREMVTRLSRRDMYVTELAAHFTVSLPGASKHIGQLEKAGLVTRRVMGRDHLIQLAPNELADAADWLATFEELWLPRGQR